MRNGQGRYTISAWHCSRAKKKTKSSCLLKEDPEEKDPYLLGDHRMTHQQEMLQRQMWSYHVTCEVKPMQAGRYFCHNSRCWYNVLCRSGPMNEELKPEQVQGKAIGYIQEITNPFYEWTLNKLGLFSLAIWKLRKDTVPYYKYIKVMCKH